MVRTSWALLAALVIVIPAAVHAADEAPAGNYKLTFAGRGGQQVTFWLIKVESKDGKSAASIVSTLDPQLKSSTLEDFVVSGDNIRFNIKFQGQSFSFDGKLPKEKNKPILGSFLLGPQMTPAQLEPTQLKALDPYELAKEVFNKPDVGPELFDAIISLMGDAAEKKAKPEDVRAWADKGSKAAEAYGSRWQRDFTLRMVTVLASQEGFTPVALEYARRAERLIDPKADAATQMAVLRVLQDVLKKSDKPDELKDVQARMAKLESQDYLEYKKSMLSFEHPAYAGRKAKSDRVVLVELFTGAQCPPCVAADLAFDAVHGSYKPTEVALLQYHLHIPGPDPLTNADTEARQEFYGRSIKGTPTVFFNGKVGASGGGGAADAADKYKEFRELIDPLLEKPSKAKLQASAVLKGNEIVINAKVSDLEEASEDIKLRFALVEETVRYQGSNRLRYHHNVVRDMPGGVKGVALPKKTAEQSVTVNLEQLRKKLSKYLASYAEENEFPNSDRPLDLKNLRVVAFIQNDDTREILQAVSIEVKKASE